MAAGKKLTQRGLEKRVNPTDPQARELETNVDESFRRLESEIESLKARVFALENP